MSINFTAVSPVSVHRVDGRGQIIAVLMQTIAVMRQRRALKSLSQDELTDIGISRADAMTEAQRPFWDLPSHY